MSTPAIIVAAIIWLGYLYLLASRKIRQVLGDIFDFSFTRARVDARQDRYSRAADYARAWAEQLEEIQALPSTEERRRVA